jgi:hypothetical protein
MEATIVGEFETRRSTELAVEHVVQEFGVPREDVFIQPVGSANSAGTKPAGADEKTAPEPEEHRKLEGAIEVSFNFCGDDPQTIVDALKNAGARTVRSK